MNRVLFSAEGIPLPTWLKAAEAFVQQVLSWLGLDNWELSVLFCDNRYIKTLNAQFRDKDEPTDVLSFPLGETIHTGKGESSFLAGDIAISLDALGENAGFFDVSVDEELRRLLIHGILHLSGADHTTNDDEEPMLRIQEEILKDLEGIREDLIFRSAEMHPPIKSADPLHLQEKCP